MRHRNISVAHPGWCATESWYFCGAPSGCATEIYFSGEISVAHPTISRMRHRNPILGMMCTLTDVRHIERTNDVA